MPSIPCEPCLQLPSAGLLCAGSPANPPTSTSCGSTCGPQETRQTCPRARPALGVAIHHLQHQDQQLDGETELPGHAHLTLVTPPVTLSHGPEHTTSTRSVRTQAISLSMFGNAVTHVTHDIMKKISNHGDQDKDILTRTTDVPEVLTVQCVHSV